MQMVIRELEEADYVQWKALWFGYLDSYVSEVSEEVTNTTFKRLLSDNEPMHCLMAEVDGKLFGLAHYVCHRSTWTTGDYCYLQDLYVQTDARLKGAGLALVTAVVDAAKALNCTKVYWKTREDNYRARALYDKVASKTNFVEYRAN